MADSNDSARPANDEPKRMIGPIATGDKIIAFSDILEKHRQDWPKLLGVEMEAGGVAATCFQSQLAPGFFMIRCVSDLADENKDADETKKWRAYVCDTAAAYAIGLLRHGPIVAGAGH